MFIRIVFLTSVLAIIFNSISIAQVIIPDSVLLTLKKGHPRLMVTSFNDFHDIKARAASDEFLKLSIKNVMENADSVLEQPVMTYVKLGKPGIDLRTIYFRTLFLSMAYRLTEDKKYSTRLWAELDAESKFPDWNQELFIITGGMLQCFAVAYDWLYDVWTPEQRGLFETTNHFQRIGSRVKISR